MNEYVPSQACILVHYTNLSPVSHTLKLNKHDNPRILPNFLFRFPRVTPTRAFIGIGGYQRAIKKSSRWRGGSIHPPVTSLQLRVCIVTSLWRKRTSLWQIPGRYYLYQHVTSDITFAFRFQPRFSAHGGWNPFSILSYYCSILQWRKTIFRELCLLKCDIDPKRISTYWRIVV